EPPAAGISQTWLTSSSSSPPLLPGLALAGGGASDRKAIALPSGDHSGRDSLCVGVRVSCTRPVPSYPTRHRSVWARSSFALTVLTLYTSALPSADRSGAATSASRARSSTPKGTGGAGGTGGAAAADAVASNAQTLPAAAMSRNRIRSFPLGPPLVDRACALQVVERRALLGRVVVVVARVRGFDHAVQPGDEVGGVAACVGRAGGALEPDRVGSRVRI